MRNITQIFKALSDSTRVRILWMLQAGGELCVCDLMEVLELPQSTVSRHLAYLRNAGLVRDHRKGVWMFYRLPDEPGAVLTGILTVLLSAAQEMNQAAVDRRHLSEYLAARDADACSGEN